ncbi:unnamed protein product [Ostreobium quekettii]|uniref:AB hydrolase-1 domain-containing protein n=1 Tax=Ostreobium quekettii TaxID=121088 RepID=A0A8S1ITV8_9CHLO|nr:unnamed protein product [Ostreobium quekettii]
MERKGYFQTNLREVSQFRRTLSNQAPQCRTSCSEHVVRCVNCMQFTAVCACGMVHVVTPWMLGAIEATLMLVLYFVVVPDSLYNIEGAAGALGSHASKKYHFGFAHSTEDVLILSLVRVVLLSVSYGFGSGKYCHRPYYVVALFTSTFMVPYMVVKAAVTVMSPVMPMLALVATSVAFSIVHIVVAHLTVKRTQRRVNMGLIGFGYPWEEGEEAWVMAGRQQSIRESTMQEGLLSSDDDVPREMLADESSKFVDCGGLSVHYKEEYPRGRPCVGDGTFAVVFIHGFGGGVFAWRNLMRPLAELCGCRVVAFDRPAFGLTARPQVSPDRVSPYTTAAQKKLTVQLCQALGIRQLILVGHSDGCVLALMVAAALGSRRPQTGLSAEPKEMVSVSRCTSASSGREQSVEIGLSVRNSSGVPEESLPGRLSCGAVSLEGSIQHSGATTTTTSTLDSAASSSSSSVQSQGLTVEAIVFLHPDFSCDEGLSFTNLLMQSKLGRRFLRPLLRSEIGEVANRRAWYDTSKLTREILDLYKAPLRIQGWDSALVEFTRVRNQVTPQQISECQRRVGGVQVMVVTGDKDRIVTPEKAASIANDFGTPNLSVIPDCGHISHEECHEMLLDLLTGFVEHSYGALGLGSHEP